MTARLIFICHASTDALRTFAFPGDGPIDDVGRTRAAELGDRLPSANRCYSSPELRTRQTAESLQLSAKVQPLLRECDYGAWIGCNFDDVCARDPQGVTDWLSNPAATPHGGESILSLMQRVAVWLADEQAHHARSIVVAHPSIIRAAIIHAIEAAPQSFWRIDIAPLSITRLSGIKGRWNLLSAGCKSPGGVSD
jgi:broad specificity phosphatase PhoE